MVVTASFVLNSCSYHGMTLYNLRSTPGVVEEHGVIRKTHASSLGFRVKDLTKVNATRVGAMRSISLKPKMVMLDQIDNYPSMDSDRSLNPGLGRMVDSFVFRQNIYIKTYEVGPDRTASVETLMNHMQETSINHLKEIGVLGDGLGLTKKMCKSLITVMAKLQVAVDRYPIWGDVVQVDTWKGAYGKIGIMSNWMFRDCKSGEILIRASCVWLMMDKETRKLSRIPNEVRAELEPFLTEKPLNVKDDTRKWSKRDENIVEHVRNGLMPRWSDLDINQHVNNVKYIGWILESVPNTILEKYEIASMTLEYHRECRIDSVVHSRTSVIGTNNADDGHVDCEHLLQLEVGSEDGKIMKGKTRWRLKH